LWNHEQIKKRKKRKKKEKKEEEVTTQDSMGKPKFFIITISFNPWVVLATWLHVGAPQEIQEKIIYNPF
jgi:hypothetical protein